MPTAPKLLFASAVLFASWPVFATEEASKVTPLTFAVIKCPGITYIPMTVDPEQSLPLRLVSTLSCGERVYLLAEDEGYTVHIRTGDGKEGYVARMYVAELLSSPVGIARHASAATPMNGAVRWAAGGAGCDEFLSHGRHVESITANGITVQVSLQDTGWKYRANVAISNQSSFQVDVTSGIITLDELTPNLRSLPSSDLEKLAHASTHQVFWTFADALPSPSAVVQQLVQAPEADRLAYRGSPTPDYLDPLMTLASERPAVSALTAPVDVQAIALKSASLSAGQSTAGVMWFARDADAHELSLRVPVADLVFDFAFSFRQKR